MKYYDDEHNFAIRMQHTIENYAERWYGEEDISNAVDEYYCHLMELAEQVNIWAYVFE